MVLLGVVAGCLLAGPRAMADKGAGLSLFDEADKLGAAGNWKDACPKFEASQKAYPRPLGLLRLADCYERIGKTATAWATFRETAVAARAAQTNPAFNPEQERRRESEATRRLGEIEKRLTKVRVMVPAPVPGLVVRRDGDELPAGSWGTAIAVDPGKLTFDASAPGYVGWKDTIDVAGEGKTVDVTVPGLKSEAKAVEAPKPTSPAEAPARVSLAAPAADVAPGRATRTLGLAFGIGGLVVGGVGTYLGLKGSSDFKHPGDDHGACNDACQANQSTASTKVHAGWGLVGVGAAAVVTGVVLWVGAPSGDKPGTKVGLVPGGITVSGSF